MSELTPVSSFSACYLIPENPSIGKALVIAPTSANVSQVHVGKGQISSAVKWEMVDSQPYSWAMIDLPSDEHRVIWHPSTKIGVYVQDGGSWSEAIIISKEPALQGCLVDRSSYSVIDQSGTWAEMIGHCQQENGELLSINNEGILQELSRNLNNPHREKEVWVGLRRRLLNGDWYWLNKQPMNVTKWFHGQPGNSEDKFCASMSLSSDNNKNLRWKSRSCCHTLKPVCYKNDVYFPLTTPV
ncbi:macrophage mannose receptor 1-like [Sardina pilchardus]|uniref:macrophage mannose receptor 1-like n=1 Tax=Sardina pilchardus TaxID=27697 RepID=UPI002E121791